jgi:hypothetical protein
MVPPALVRKKFGKADLLLGLMPIMHRPYYYLVWVDAEWFDDMCQYVDDIWYAIEEEFGHRESEDVAPYRWPEVDDEGGCCWFKADIDDILTPRRRARLATGSRERGVK